MTLKLLTMEMSGSFLNSYTLLLEQRLLRPFLERSYGLELVLKLFELKTEEKEVSIDELFGLLKSPTPRREAFGLFLNQLADAQMIEKNKHSKKKTMKSIELSQNVFNLINDII